MKKIKILLLKIPKIYYILFLVTIVLFLPSLINGGIHGDDATFHLVNIMGMDKNSSFTSLPTLIRPYMGNNLCYGTGIFYPQFMHTIILYIWKVLDIVHLPLSVAVICFFFIFTFTVSIFMYKLLYKLSNNKNISVLGSIFYITYPYFIADIYRRSAYGELFAFLSLPIIFLGIYSLFYEKNKGKFYTYFILGFYLLFSTHLISTVYTTLYTLVFLLFQGKKLFKKENLIPLIIATLIVIGMSLIYIVPIFEHKLLGDYMVFQSNHMYSRSSVIENVLSFKQLLIPNDWLTTNIPIFMIALLILVIVKFKKITESIDKKILIGFISMLVLSIICVTIPYLWKVVPEILIMIQFPWRNCAYLCFSICILSTLGLTLIPKKYLKVSIITCIVLTIVSILYMFLNPSYTLRKNTTFSLRDGGLGWEKEYMPVNAYKNIKYFNNRDEDILVIDGEAEIYNIKNKAPNLDFCINTKENVVVEIPRLYYLYYKVTFSNDNKTQKLTYKENDKGFIELNIPSSGCVSVKYEKSLIAKISSGVSIMLTIFCIGGLVIYNKKNK